MHDDRHQAPPQAKGGPDWRKPVAGVAVGLILAGASAVSLMHLSAGWREQAPVRAARAAAAAAADEARRAEAETERLRDDLSGRNPDVPAGVVTEEQMAAALAARTGQAGPKTLKAPAPPAPTQPVTWRVAPQYQVRRGDIAPGFTDVGVRFHCRATRDGRLTGCTATETPAGSGLARAALPALERARLEPMLVRGQPVESTITFGISFHIDPPAPRPSVPAPAAATPPAEISVAAQVPAEVATPPAEEAVPEA